MLVRTDIELGNQMAQISHACLDAGNTFKQMSNPSNVVILQVKDEEALLKAGERAARDNIRYVSFYESEFPVGTHAICTEPITAEQRRTFKNYKLWK